MMMAGILIGSPARIHRRSSAITPIVIEGGTVEGETSVETSDFGQ